jgi:ABC-2 type transport system permease protein
MSIRRIAVLLSKEVLQGPKNYLFIMAIITPLLVSLVFTLVFGTLFSEKPRLGIVDEGSSQLVMLSQENEALVTREYVNISEMTEAVEIGSVDIGIVLPEDFDNAVAQGEESALTAYIWGESLSKNRIILGVTIANMVQELTGQESPIILDSITLGDEVAIPWNARLLPLVVLVSVFLGGMLFTGTAVIQEKEKRTLTALVVTPTSLGEIFASKGLLGVIISLFAGIMILVLNQAFGIQPVLLIILLVLGALMAAGLGLLLGALLKDITTLFAIWKSAGILIFAPALIYMFAQIPEWVGRLFPTYYLLQPIFDISQFGAGWSEIALNVFILIGLDIVIFILLAVTLRRKPQFAT